MPAVKKSNPIPPPDMSGNTKEAKARRANYAQRFSPFGHKGGPLLPPEEATEWHRKGGIAAQESRKKRKALSHLMKNVLDMPASQEMMKVCGIVDMFPDLRPEEITMGMLLTVSVLGRGISTGKADQYTVIRDTIGEKPRDNLTVTGEDGAPLHPPTVNVLFADEGIRNRMKGE